MREKSSKIQTEYNVSIFKWCTEWRGDYKPRIKTTSYDFIDDYIIPEDVAKKLMEWLNGRGFARKRRT